MALGAQPVLGTAVRMAARGDWIIHQCFSAGSVAIGISAISSRANQIVLRLQPYQPIGHSWWPNQILPHSQRQDNSYRPESFG